MPPTGGLSRRRDEKTVAKKARADVRGAAQPAEVAPPVPPPLGDEFALPTREYVRPSNQLMLTEAELAEELPRMLNANNPVAPKNVARFNMKERCFKFEAMVDQTVVHFGCDGWLLHKDSEDAKKQLDAERAEAEAAVRFQAEVDRAAREKEAGMDSEPPDDSRRLRNRFNFGERAVQTFNYALRERGTLTEPPPTATASGSCSAWEVYDEYMRDAERQRAEEASKPRAGGLRRNSTAVASSHAAATAPPVAGSSGPSTLQGPAAGDSRGGGGGVAARGTEEDGESLVAAAGPGVERALRILDRMVVQNSYTEVALDFRYWDDATDAFRPGEGSLLPLWKFQCPKGKKHVTSIAWSPAYSDMFAVGYGSFHFHRQTGGLVAIHSLKNPAAPENMFLTSSGVMAVHFHPTNANLLAVGCYDGSVAVFDARRRGGGPLYQATVKSGKHSDAVWQVLWQEDELQATLQFTSVSTDGDVTLWTLSKGELVPEKLMRLTAPGSGGCSSDQGSSGGGSAGASPGGGAARKVVGGVCMDFNQAPGKDHEYLVGTEDGAIVECSKAYSSEYLASFAAHNMAVYAVRWNRLHPSIFLSASVDWTLRVWDVRTPCAGPPLTFDLGDAVGDAAWAPFSSTVMAAVTDGGRVHVFDLAANRLAPLCVQKVVRSARLTKLAFNPKHPVLLVGDSKGTVTCFKLSPNLRRGGTAAAGATGGGGRKGDPAPSEVQRLDAVLDVARKGRSAGTRAGAGAA